jgi:hypothetical protein
LIAQREKLNEGLSTWPYKTREILFSQAYGKEATEGERFNVYFFDRFVVLCQCYEFVRLLEESPPSAAVRGAIGRLQPVFAEALQDIARNIDLDQFAVIDCDTLAKVQLGSGLIALNSMLQERGREAP